MCVYECGYMNLVPFYFVTFYVTCCGKGVLMRFSCLSSSTVSVFYKMKRVKFGCFMRLSFERDDGVCVSYLFVKRFPLASLRQV